MERHVGETDGWTLLTIALLTVVTVLTRCLFFLSSSPWSLPHWAQRGLQYAPIAALGAVVIPEVVMTQGHLIGTWQDPRLFAMAAGGTWFYWRKGVLGTIVAGMAVYLPLRLVLGWGG
jgi:branched-subunit amino acid transport protein